MSEVDSDAGFDDLATFVEDEMSFATSHYNDSYLKRRFTSRIRRTDTENFEEYHELLVGNPEEQQALLDALSINVTGFFRNPDVWEGIRERLRELTEERSIVRAWSAACADGREPYSLSMLAHDDARCDPKRVRIRATDINDESLDHARNGIYENTRTIDVDEQLQFLSNYHSYVERSGDRFRMRQNVRAPIRFEKHDLINDESKSEFDLVMCRNLFIYIDNEYKQPVLSTIAESMRSGGYLVIGKAETIPPALQSAFEVVDSTLRIYQRV
ncbi:CheR family methyltransferase [Salinarchaeum laminariae]|uniref:CheR family methyltransferase n=1 Tax=Salinarchaeum laminariae TaxID=869888 RepID=UPI002174F32F|nr:protein-glutamate O-methyltransferase CheR [Salinarchaeum laminariae]